MSDDAQRHERQLERQAAAADERTRQLEAALVELRARTDAEKLPRLDMEKRLVSTEVRIPLTVHSPARARVYARAWLVFCTFVRTASSAMTSGDRHRHAIGTPYRWTGRQQSLRRPQAMAALHEQQSNRLRAELCGERAAAALADGSLREQAPPDLFAAAMPTYRACCGHPSMVVQCVPVSRTHV